MKFYKGKVKLEARTEVARDTVKYLFSAEDFDFTAGQFISMQFGDAWRAYSIASTPKEDLIELVVRLIPGGIASEMFRVAKVGDEFNFTGPFGEFILSDNKYANLIFLGTGTGIAPFRSMILTEKENLNRPMKLLYGGKDSQDLAYLDEMESWADNLEIGLGLSRQEDASDFKDYAQHCRITKFLEDGEFDENSEFYICGSGIMTESVVKILTEKGVAKERIFHERFN